MYAVCICPNSKTHLSKLASAAEIVRQGNNAAAANCKWQQHDTMQFEKRSKEIVQRRAFHLIRIQISQMGAD